MFPRARGFRASRMPVSMAARLGVETLESRFAPAIFLDLVSLHEFGHSLGLDHSKNPTSIMYKYYNANYTADLSTDPAVVVNSRDGFTSLREIYKSVESGPWKDSRDPFPGNGKVDITYSFMKDGTATDKGTSNLFVTMNARFAGGPASWQTIFINQLQRWSVASGGILNFIPFDHNLDVPNGEETTQLGLNASGNVQNDSRFGDIRIGSHVFDGASNVLAHAYLPPSRPRDGTATGDAHFDSAEDWALKPAITSAAVSTTSTGGGNGSPGNNSKLKKEPLQVQPGIALEVVLAASNLTAPGNTFTNPTFLVVPLAHVQQPLPQVVVASGGLSFSPVYLGGGPGGFGTNQEDGELAAPRPTRSVPIAPPAPIAPTGEQRVAPGNDQPAGESPSATSLLPLAELAEFGLLAFEEPTTSRLATPRADQLSVGVLAGFVLGMNWKVLTGPEQEPRRPRLQVTRGRQ